METVMDRGPWRLYYSMLHQNRLVGLISEDFTRDAVLEVSGDFAPEDRLKYCEWLRDVLNRAGSRPTVGGERGS